MAISGPEQHPPDSEVAADQPGSNGLPNPGGKESEGEDELNTPKNPSGSTPTQMNPQQPLTASAPLPTLAPTLPAAGLGLMHQRGSFCWDEVFQAGDDGWDFNFGPDFELQRWLDPTLPDMVEMKPRFDPIRKNNPWFDPIVVHDGPSLDTT